MAQLKISSPMKELLPFNKASFFGTLNYEYELFEYLIVDSSKKGIFICTPRHLERTFPLKEWDIINFHLQFEHDNKYFSLGQIGDIASSTEQLSFEVSFQDPEPLRSHLWLSLNENNPEKAFLIREQEKLEGAQFVRKIYKHLILAKQAILVYLKHFAPYFSRLVNSSAKEYHRLEEFFFFETQEKIKIKTKELKNFYDSISDGQDSEELYHQIDFDKLKRICDIDINTDILNISFQTLKAVPYLLAIKNIEQMIYNYYNQLILFFLIPK